MTEKLTNKPVTPTEEMLELLKDWVAPDVTERKKAELVGKTNFLGVPIEEMYSQLRREEEQAEEEEVPQLTAEEIEKIRQDAYDEGFAEGKEAGFAAGQEEGLEKGHEEGVERGHQVGLEQGLELGQGQIQQQVEHWQTLIAQLEDPISRVDKAVEMQLLDLALMLAKAVIRSETKTNPDVLLNVLHEAVSSLPFNTEYAELHLHPDDIELIQQTYDEEALAERKWILKEEPGYQPGDLIVGTPNSLIDRTLKHRIAQTIDGFIQGSGLDKEQVAQPGALSKSVTEESEREQISEEAGPVDSLEAESESPSTEINESEANESSADESND